MTSQRGGGVDRSHGVSGAQKNAFYALHGLSVAICAWVVFFGGAAWVGDRFGWSAPSAPSPRAALMFAVTLLYFLRHGLTLYSLIVRRITWSEGLGLGGFMIVQEVGLCLLAAGLLGPRPSLGALDAAALGLVALGSFLNTASEVQRKRWKRHPEHRGACYTGGLFRYAVHINYFGDSVMTTGWVLLSRTWWTASLPLLMVLSFVLFHIPALDAYLAERYGEPFRSYAAGTKRFVPFVY